MIGFVRVAAGEPPLSVSAGAGTVRIAAFAVLIAAATWLARAVALLQPTTWPAICPVAGIALAGILLSGNRLWIGIVLGVIVGNAARIVGGGLMELAAVFAVAAAVALQAIIAAAVFRAVSGTNDPFHRAWDAGWFVVLAAGWGCLIHPTVATTAACLVDGQPWDKWLDGWLPIWLADNAGVLLVAPLLLAWMNGSRPLLGRWQGPELILMAIAPGAICWLICRTGHALDYLYLPIIAWASFRFGPRGGTASALIVAAVAVATTTYGAGSFVGESLVATRLLLGSFISMVGACTLVLLGVIAQRDAAERGLADAHATLETRVRLRTQELAAANGRLRRIADLDGLTGIANRRYFDQTLETEWRKAEDAKRPIAVVLLDVDHFKTFNDTYGHPAGDDCLHVIADAMADGLQRSGELLARYGGEEFVALLPNADGDDAVEAAERLRSRVAGLGISHCMPKQGSQVTLSAGVASEVPTRGRTPADLLADADTALYAAKRAGRNRVMSSV